MYGGVHPPRPAAQGVYHLVTARETPLTANTAQLSWEKTLGVFNSRLANTALTNLRHWREIVAGVYSDFEANIPDPEAGPLVLRAWSLDGRTEDSRYPNLMLPEVGKQYGIY